MSRRRPSGHTGTEGWAKCNKGDELPETFGAGQPGRNVSAPPCFPKAILAIPFTFADSSVHTKKPEEEAFGRGISLLGSSAHEERG